MTIWVDADACPNAIKQILFRAAERTGTELVLVANQALQVPASRHIRAVQVASGFDVADDYIVQEADAGDLVITGDIPLSAEVIEKGCQVVNNRGERLTPANIRQLLNMRDFMDTMRSSGVTTGGPPPFGQREKQAFANSLDRYLGSTGKT